MSIRIGIGPGIGAPLSARDYWRWVDCCEAGGIDSIWHSDQLLGATLEPLAALAALAARTTRMRFGTNALVAPFRDPLTVAKQFATIDFLSEGRLLPVFGVGQANDPYWAATGSSSAGRGARGNEAIALIRQLLEQDTVAFDGAVHRYSGPGVQPRPAGPMPLWIGGNSNAAIRRTAELGDGWLGGLVSPGQAGEIRRRIETALLETGRSIDPDHYGVSLPFRIGPTSDPAGAAARDRLLGRAPPPQRHELEQSLAIGDVDRVVALFGEHVRAGMSKFVAVPIVNDAAELMAQTELLIRHVLPALEDRPLENRPAVTAQ